jgi:glycerol-3-phosphate dehydrogenase
LHESPRSRTLTSEPIDLLIVGGGINGAGIARDAAGRGLTVMLAEQDDLAAHTSSASTKLIHGGLRYLEQYEFRLVREALQERERLLAMAPHIIWPLTFVLPHSKDMRPAWLLRLGLFLYDHIGGRRRLPASRALRLNGIGLGAGLRPTVQRGFSYADCWVEDSRLVVLNAADAAAHGAQIRTRTRLAGARREGALWHVALEDVVTGDTSSVQARMLVNAAGPWVADVAAGALGRNSARGVRLVKGSHIVIPRLYDGDHAYILQNPDKRIVFTIPYEGRFTLIGTTDVPVETPLEAKIDASEIAYLCEAAGRWFSKPVAPADVVWSYSGVRPLYDDGSASASEVTRDYVLDLDAPPGAAPVLSVFGGKITTYRRLAEHALEKLGVAGKSWTASKPLPGGDIAGGDFDAFVAALQHQKPFLPPDVARRLARAYGTSVHAMLGSAESMADLGEDFGIGVTEAEIRYLMAAEFARTAADVLWRRSKLGLHLTAAAQARIAIFMEAA